MAPGEVSVFAHGGGVARGDIRAFRIGGFGIEVFPRPGAFDAWRTGAHRRDLLAATWRKRGVGGDKDLRRILALEGLEQSRVGHADSYRRFQRRADALVAAFDFES